MSCCGNGRRILTEEPQTHPGTVRADRSMNSCGAVSIYGQWPAYGGRIRNQDRVRVRWARSTSGCERSRRCFAGGSSITCKGLG